MLSHINIKNFAIVDRLELELNDQLSVMTGETGAGKSILIDALGLVLGDRADTGFIRHGSEKSEITASFSLKNNAEAITWLNNNDLEPEPDSENECIIRRTVNKDGRSRAYINGQTINIGYACPKHFNDCSRRFHAGIRTKRPEKKISKR